MSDANARADPAGGVSTEPTDAERYLVVRGRRWRRSDPRLPEEAREALVFALGRARSAVRTAPDDVARTAARRRVQAAKEGLGERGMPWWDLDELEALRRARDRLDRLVELEGEA